MARKTPASPRQKKESPNGTLTTQELRFCHLVASGLTHAESYRRAYADGAPIAWSNGTRVAHRPPIAACIAQLRAEMAATATATRAEKLRLLETQMRDPDLPPRDRQGAIKLHNEMTGDNAPIQHQVGLSDSLIQSIRSQCN